MARLSGKEMGPVREALKARQGPTRVRHGCQGRGGVGKREGEGGGGEEIGETVRRRKEKKYSKQEGK